MNTEKVLSGLEEEVKALKNAFEQTGLQLPVYTYDLYFTTTVNHVRITYPGGQYVDFDGAGRTVVTFTSERGSNALANLEIYYNDGGIGLSELKYRRVPFPGGARWVVYDQGGVINYHFVVHSTVPGSVGAKMIWQ